MRSKNLTLASMLLTVMCVQISFANQIIYSSNGSGQVKIEIGNSGATPSVIMSNGVFSTGIAAQIMAQNINPQIQVQTNLNNVSIKAIQSTSTKKYLGSMTQIGRNIYMGSAHTLSRVTKADLFQFARSESLNLDQLKIFQFKSHQKYIDAIIFTDRSDLKSGDRLSQISDVYSLQLNNQSGDEYTALQMVNLDRQLVSQKYTGQLFVADGFQYLYTLREKNGFLTWGSSGSVILSKSQLDPKIGISGVVQCAVQQTQVSSSSSQVNNQTYFRIISSKYLNSAILEERQIAEIKSSVEDLNLEDCEAVSPIGGRDGGGAIIDDIGDGGRDGGGAVTGGSKRDGTNRGDK